MSKKNAAKAHNPNRIASLLIMFIMCVVVAVMLIQCLDIYQKNQSYAAEQTQLQQQLEEEEARTEEIEAYREYIKTDEFVEEVAYEKLGLIYKGEIIFKED
jgi:cell division protein DivIC